MIDALTSFIHDAGLLAPLYYIGAHILTAIVPIVPTPLVAALGGTAFGFVAASLYGVLGLAMGAIVALSLARTVGRPLLQRLLGRRASESWEEFLGIRSVFAWALVFLTLNLDFTVLAAGLTALPLHRLWVAAIVARIPWLLASVWFGDTVLVSDTVILVMAVLLIPAFYLLNKVRPVIRRWLLDRIDRSVGQPAPGGSEVAQARVQNVANGIPEKVEAND